MAARRKLFLADFAELAGVKPATLAAYRTRGDAGFPEPDGQEIDRHYVRPWWWESTARRWLKSRPGPGFWGPRHARAS